MDSEEYTTDDGKRKREDEQPKEAFKKSKKILRTPSKRNESTSESEEQESELKKYLKDILTETKEIKTEQREYREEIKERRKENQNLHKEINELKTKMEKMDWIESKMEKLERENKRNNIIIKGLKMTSSNEEEIVKKTENIMKYLNVETKIRKAVKINETMCMVELENFQQKMQAIKNKYKLSSIKDEIYITSNLTEKEREIRKQIKESKMQHFKPLHVARNLQELNQNIKKNFSWEKFPRPKDAAKKLYQESQTDPLDEERTYILLSRFLGIYNYLLETSEDKGLIELLLGKEANKSSTQLDSVKSNLLKRYEAEAKKAKEVTMIVAPVEKVQQHISVFGNRENPFISCMELQNALKKFNLLIMDVRDETEFKESHIKDVKCINIPEHLIQSGLSAHTLGKTLPKESLEQWEKRDSFDVIVLMDWHTNTTSYTASKLDKLRNILLEWDIDRTYNESPVVLNNGYGEFLDVYPTLCSSSNIRYLKANAELDELLNLDSIEYPSEGSSKHPPDVRFNDEVSPSEETESKSSQLLKHIEQLNNIQNKINNEYNISVLEDLKRTEKAMADALAKFVSEVKDETETESSESTAPVIEDPTPALLQLSVSDSTKSQDELQQLLDQVRQVKKPTIKPESEAPNKPFINRATKPKKGDPTSILPFQSKAVGVQGLTGLTNIKNTCYLNTIMQCLRHIPEIYEFYFTKKSGGDFRQPCAILAETGNLVCALWSDRSSVIRPTEFYNKLTILAPTYKEGHHEDCMEFFIQLFTFLSEDCAYEVNARNSCSDADRAWHTQHFGKQSYFIETFYYQIRLVQNCACGFRNTKYEIENVFYLTIPNHNFSLEDCMKTYLRDVERFICKKCRNIKSVNKSICRYPSVLVIALKRHIVDYIANSIPIFKKNESRCNFPVDTFYVDRVPYYLKAVAMHSGTPEAGHYTAACLNPYTKGWYLFNDESVTPFDIRDKSVGVKSYAFFYSKTN
ncbi:hypothetical protein FQR65_LT11794 [Abscondita terminalis]|nr:hypothetical protein FQR65_LT11794 [Abscondita terminalis]